jgi:hypothetical protein
MTGKIFDNILFLAEVFGDRADEDTLTFRCWSWREALSFRSRGLSGPWCRYKFVAPLEMIHVNYRITELNGWFIVMPTGKQKTTNP